VSISGNIRTMPFADLLQWVFSSRKTGTLVIEGQQYTKKLHFREGTVVAASSENPREFLGFYLVGWGYLGEEELQHMLDMQERHGTMLGELLVIVGRLTRDELEHLLRVKTEESIYDLFIWEAGEFRFLDGVMPVRKFQPLQLPVDSLILEGVRRQDEWRRILQVIPEATYIPKVVRAVDVQQMGPVELAILREIDGQQSIEQIAMASRLPEFHIFSFVYYGVDAQLFDLLPPTGPPVPIPGFSRSSWRVLLKEAEGCLKDGDLLGCFQQVKELRDKYPDHRDVQEHASGIESKLKEELDRAAIQPSAVPELAIGMQELTKLDCGPLEGFVLSRVNGMYTIGQIMQTLPGSEVENLLIFRKLIEREVIRLQHVEGPSSEREFSGPPVPKQQRGSG
jgi:hypothetical protein